jgi:hypothetical protein
MMKKNSPGTVQTQKALAAALSVSPKTIRNWLQRPGNPGKEPGGSFSVVRWLDFQVLFANSPQLARGNRDSVEAKVANLRLQNEKLKFQLDVMRRNYVPVEENEKTGAALGMEIKRAVQQVHLLAPSLAGLPTAEIDLRLKEAENEILARLHTFSSQHQWEVK